MKPLLSVLFMGVMTLSLTHCSMDSSSTTTTPGWSSPRRPAHQPASAASPAPPLNRLSPRSSAPPRGSYADLDPQAGDPQHDDTGGDHSLHHGRKRPLTGNRRGREYRGPISVTASETITTIAYMTGASSAASTAVYTIAGTVAAPTFTPVAGTFPGTSPSRSAVPPRGR